MKFEITFREGENIHEMIAQSGIIDWIAKNTIYKRVAKTDKGKIWKGEVYVVTANTFVDIVEDSNVAGKTIENFNK